MTSTELRIKACLAGEDLRRCRRLQKREGSSPVTLADELEEGRMLSIDQRDFGGDHWKNTHPFRNVPSY